MGRAIVWVAAFAIALAGLVIPHRAWASEPLYARSCVLASDRALSLPEARASSGWICQPRAGAAVAPYLWLRASPESLPHGERQRLEGDAMPMAGLVTYLRFADGSVRERRFGPADIAAHWTAGTRFSLRLYTAAERPVELFVRIDQPFDRQVANALELDDGPVARARQLRDMILFGVFTGMLLVVALYSLSLWVALRAGFALSHASMVGFFLVYTIASSSLVFMLFPGAGLWLRASLSYIGLALSMAMMAPFLCGYLERRALTPGLRRLAYASAGLIAIAGLAVPLLGPYLPFVMRGAYHLAYVPGLAAFAIVCVGAWRRGSRAVKLVALAWSLPLACAIERIGRATGLHELPFQMDFALFIAMAFQAIVMAFAISWRIGEIRRERDRALKQGNQMARMARTDSLTGLPNRRAFDARHWREGDFLAVIDVDRFKCINDSFGHTVGDEALRVMGVELMQPGSPDGLLGAWRLGGEEFAVLIEARSAEAAALAVNRLRARLSAAIASGVPAIAHPVTASAGLARIGPEGIAAAYEIADRALYHAKASGRDRLSWEAEGRQRATIFPRNGPQRDAA